MDFLKNAVAIFCITVMGLVAGCGGSNDPGNPSMQPRLLTSTTVGPADHTTIVQQLYISYFGRPADTGGLASFMSMNSSGAAGAAGAALFAGAVTSQGAFAGGWTDEEDGGGTFTARKQ